MYFSSKGREEPTVLDLVAVVFNIGDLDHADITLVFDPARGLTSHFCGPAKWLFLFHNSRVLIQQPSQPIQII